MTEVKLAVLGSNGKLRPDQLPPAASDKFDSSGKLVDTAIPSSVALKNPRRITVRATGTDAQNTAAFQAALDSIPNDYTRGVTIVLSGIFNLTQTIVVSQDNVQIEGDGSAKISRNGDFPCINYSAARPNRRYQFGLSKLYMYEHYVDDYVPHPSPALVGDRCSNSYIDDVKAIGFGGPWWTGENAWDSAFTRIALYLCGRRDHSRPAIHATSKDYGGFLDTSNNLWFDKCLIEQFYGGAIWLDSDPTTHQGQHLHRFGLLKLEQNDFLLPVLRMQDCEAFMFGDQVQVTIGNTRPSQLVGSLVSPVEFIGGNTINVVGCSFYIPGDAPVAGCEALMTFNGSSRPIYGINGGVLLAGGGWGTNKPEAVAKFKGTTTHVIPPSVIQSKDENMARIAGIPTSLNNPPKGGGVPPSANGLKAWSYDILTAPGTNTFGPFGVTFIRVPLDGPTDFTHACIFVSEAVGGASSETSASVGVYRMVDSITLKLVSKGPATEAFRNAGPQAIPQTAEPGESRVVSGDAAYIGITYNTTSSYVKLLSGVDDAELASAFVDPSLARARVNYSATAGTLPTTQNLYTGSPANSLWAGLQ